MFILAYLIGTSQVIKTSKVERLKNKMEIPPKAVEELRQVHKQHTGEDLSFEEAAKMAEDLFRLFNAVAKPIPKRLLEEQKDQFPELYQALIGGPKPPEEDNSIGFKLPQ